MNNIRTRFAPSPTGYIHVGNVRSALYPYFVARQGGGKFILRIEDTDQNRFVEGAEDLIMEVLNWMGLDWDEGPLLRGGEEGLFGPYHQTDRKEIYLKWAQKLIDKGLAYPDYRTSEEIQNLKDQCKAEHRLFLYRDNRPEVSSEWDGSCPLRFKVVNPKDYSWNDAVMGSLSAGKDAVDDFIIIKSDGLPTYNFAHIVDDFEMKVTHVIRGQEYISSMPKYLALYDALEIDWPVFAHLPHIMAPQGNKKLGKRDGAKSVTEYRDEGYLPEAMLNFLACLGWNDGTENEIFTKEELINKFDLSRVQKSGARFDEKRLVWINGQWIRRLSLEDLFARSQKFWGKEGQKANDSDKKAVLKVVQDRLKTLSDIPALTEYFFARPLVDWSLVDANKQLKKFNHEELKGLLVKAISKLSVIDFSIYSEDKGLEEIQRSLNELLAETDQKPMVLFSIIRFALTWAPFSPGLPETIWTLGREETIARLQSAINE